MEHLDLLICASPLEIKAKGDGLIGGQLITYSTAQDPDISRMKDFFTAATKYDLFPGSDGVAIRPAYYHHGQDRQVGKEPLGPGTVKANDAGMWAEAQLDMANAYQKHIYSLAEQGKLGWSSGAVAHLVERKSHGDAHEVTRWPIGEISITPIPAEPRNRCQAIKSLADLIAGESPRSGMRFNEEFEAFLKSAESVLGRSAEIKALRDNQGQLTTDQWRWRVDRIRDIANNLIAELEPVPGATDIQQSVMALAARRLQLQTDDMGY